MSALERVDRLLRVVPLLADRKSVPLEELAALLDVDRPTLIADLEMLDFCGLPGLGGGDLFEVHLSDHHVTLWFAPSLDAPLRLTPAEALGLLMASQIVRSRLGNDSSALTSAITKVAAASGLDADAVVDLDLGTPELVDEVRKAIADSVKVILDYQGRADVAVGRRVVSPASVIQQGRFWYLLAHDDEADAPRHFRFDRIQRLERTDDAAVRVDAGEQEIVWHGSEDAIDVALRLSERTAWLAQILGATLEAADDAGWYRIELQTDAPQWIARLVLMTGGDVVVESPQALIDDVRRLALGTA